jgi:hypothetical protein
LLDEQHLEMYALGDRAASAAVKFVRYLEAAGPDWKKNYLARRREEYRARRAKRRRDLQLGTPDPDRKPGITPTPPAVSENPEPENPAPENPAPENPAPENPAPENPAPENPAPENQ